MIAATAAMTTPVVFELEGAESTAAASAREQFYNVVLYGTEWEVPLVKQILKLGRLPTNWDGYGSPPVGPETISAALWLMRRITAFEFENLPAPFIGPVAGGGVIFEWKHGSRQLSIAILPDRKIEYLKWQSEEQFEEEQLRSLAHLRELLTWLTRPA